MGTTTIVAVTALVTLYVTIPIRAQGDLPGPHPDLPWRPGRNEPTEEEDYVESDDDSGVGGGANDSPDSGDDVDDSPDGGGGGGINDSPDGGGGINTDYDTTWWRPAVPPPPPRPRPCWTPPPCRFGLNCGRAPNVVVPRVVYTEVSPLPPYDDPADDEGPVTPTPRRPHPTTVRTTTAALSTTTMAAGPLHVVDDHFAETDKPAPNVRVMVDYFTPTPVDSLVRPAIAAVPTTAAAPAPSSTALERTTTPTTAPSTSGGDEQRTRDDATPSDNVATTLLRSSQLVTTLRPPTTLGAVRFFVTDGGDPTHQGFAALVAVMGAASYAIARLFT